MLRTITPSKSRTAACTPPPRTVPSYAFLRTEALLYGSRRGRPYAGGEATVALAGRRGRSSPRRRALVHRPREPRRGRLVRGRRGPASRLARMRPHDELMRASDGD